MSSETKVLTSQEYLKTVHRMIQTGYPHALAVRLPERVPADPSIRDVLTELETQDFVLQMLHCRLPQLLGGWSATLLRLFTHSAKSQELLQLPLELAMLLPHQPVVRAHGERVLPSALTSGRDRVALVSAGIILSTLHHHHSTQLQRKAL